MNATRWVTLTGFISHLGQAGIVRVEDTEKGLFISWIDNSPKALAKAVSHIHPFPLWRDTDDSQESTMKKERLNKSDEQRERQMILEQIERAAAMEQ
jgi:DNA/RNA-binding protein KIN17